MTSPFHFQIGATALTMLLGTSIFAPSLAHSQETAEEHCAAVKASVADAGFADSVSVTCENGKAVITSDTYPDHTLMTGIVGTNEQVPVPAKDYAAPIPLAADPGRYATDARRGAGRCGQRRADL